MLMSAKGLLDKNPSPSEDEIKVAISGNLCRCTGYSQIITAVKKTAKKMGKVKEEVERR
jgi:carbon-monoxide dehydrogenase small subunit